MVLKVEGNVLPDFRVEGGKQNFAKIKQGNVDSVLVVFRASCCRPRGPPHGVGGSFAQVG